MGQGSVGAEVRRSGGGPVRGGSDPEAFAPGFTPASAWATLLVMTLGMLASAINATTMNTLLTVIMDEFGVSPATVQWLTTSYMLCLGVITPLTGHLITRCHVRNLFCAGLAIFTTGALLGAVQHNFAVLVAARCVQAIGSGITIPTLQIMTLYIFPYHKRGVASGVTMSTTGVAPAAGPVVAGALSDTIGWRSIFVITAVLALASLVASRALLRRVDDHPTRERLDKPSFALSTAAATCLVFFCSNLGSLGPLSPYTLAPLAAGVALLAAFSHRELRVDVPLLDLRSLRCRPFAMVCVAVIFTQGYILAINGLVCIYVQDVQGVSATLSGLTMLPGAVLSMAVAPFAGRLLDHHGPRGVVTVGFALVILGTWLLSTIDVSTPLWQPTLYQTVRFTGMSCLQQILSTWGINQLGDLTQGTAMCNSVRQIGGSATNSLFFSTMDLFMAAGGGTTAAEGVAITDTFVTMNVTQLVLAAFVLGQMYLSPKMRAASRRA